MGKREKKNTGKNMETENDTEWAREAQVHLSTTTMIRMTSIVPSHPQLILVRKASIKGPVDRNI